MMKAAVNPWFIAIRVRSLFIPTIQVLVACGVVYVTAGTLNWGVALGAWLVAVLITMGTNLVNDAIDFERGEDVSRRFGYQKVIHAGFLTKREVMSVGLATLAIACTIPFLLPVSSWVYFVVFLSALCGFAYTGGPFPISYLGLSELFIFIFYGGVCLITTFYVQAGFANAAIVLAAIQMGMLAILPNALNNMRDIFDDAAIGKRTLAVRFGKSFARWEILFFTTMPFVLNLLWIFLGYAEAALMPLLLAPVAFLFVRHIWITEPSPIFNRYFGLSVFIHFGFGILLIGGLLLG